MELGDVPKEDVQRVFELLSDLKEGSEQMKRQLTQAVLKLLQNTPEAIKLLTLPPWFTQEHLEVFFRERTTNDLPQTDDDDPNGKSQADGV